MNPTLEQLAEQFGRLTTGTAPAVVQITDPALKGYHLDVTVAPSLPRG